MQPSWSLGMAAARVVRLEPGIAGDEEHSPRLASARATPSAVATLSVLKAHKAQSYRFRGGVARVAAWHGRGDVASLALYGPAMPSPRTLRRLLARLHDEGYSEVVTNALAPGASLTLVDEGFVARDKLHLLVHELTSVPAASGLTRRARRADRDSILTLDAVAFDEFWRLDARALQEAARATPRAQLRVTPARGAIRSYGLFGRSESAGYVQRLAVEPAAQGSGAGRAVLNDGLRWLYARGAQQVFVNTQHDNDRALRLYLKAGFNRLPVGLCVLGRTL